MTRLQKLQILVFVLVVVLCGACKNEEIGRIYPLTFSELAYATRIGVTMNVSFRSGNKDYVVTSGDTAVVEAYARIDGDIGFGTLCLHGKREGKANVTVKDNVSGETVGLRITVGEFYLSFLVVQTDTAIFRKDDMCYFVQNEAKDFMVFEKKGTDDYPVLKFKGSYEFTATGDTPFVNVEYINAGQEVRHSFDMTGCSPEIFGLIEHYYLPDTAKKARDIMRYYFMNLEDVATGSKMMCVLHDLPLPEE